MEKILIVDDDIEVCQLLRSSLENKYNVAIANSYKDGFSLCKLNDYDIALLDLKLGDGSGLSILKWIKKEKPFIDVIIISGAGTIETAIKSIKLGAYDFIEKPVSEEKLKIIFRNLKERKNLIKAIQSASHNFIITENEQLKNLVNESKRIALSSVNVLITGESGVGKDIFAHLIHIESKRNTQPFIKINCAAIPESLFESELFGHQKGAFTGAVSEKKGKFELAHKGTLFFDEIGEMPFSQQAKLLRVIEDKEVVKVGSEKSNKVDVRLICATNSDLLEMVKQGRFREDLYFRLNVINIHVPPLREHKEDIPLFARTFLKQITNEEGLPGKYLTDESMDYLKQLRFKGNVRELRNLIQRLFFSSTGSTINVKDIKKIYNKQKESKGIIDDSIFNTTLSLNQAKKELEKKYILAQLKKHNNNVSQTAKALDILPNNLFRKIKELNIRI